MSDKKSKAKGSKVPGRGKKYSNALTQIDRSQKYSIDQALALAEKLSFVKFDESVELVLNLGVDPRQSDQMVRGAVVLPHGTGKSARVLVIAKGEKANEAQAAGADFVGADDMIEKIQKGWLDFDRVIATPDMMVAISKVAKILGPKGLMPNPKLGQVTMDVKKAIEDQKKGKVEYRTEKAGIVHVAIGKKSFGTQKLKDNLVAITGAIVRAKPATSKGTYLKKATLSTTMGPGIPMDTSELIATGA
jgi:large subunit ribosomal protein L1